MSADVMEPIGGYCLSLRRTKTGKVYVTRSEWENWHGDLVSTGERRLSGFYPDGAQVPGEPLWRFCIRYCDEHPGCLTSLEARDMILAAEVSATTTEEPRGHR